MEEIETNQHLLVTFRDGSSREFDDFAGYQLGSGFFAAMTTDGQMFIYPSDLIQEIVITQKGE